MPNRQILQAANLSRAFGSLKAVNDVSFSIADGECVGLIGPNGAGKSTVFDLITGVTPLDHGEIRLDRRVVSSLSPESRVKAGIARAFQIPKPFASMTVFDHLLVAQHFGAKRSNRDAHSNVQDILQQTGLTPLAQTKGGDLRLLDRKRLELAKALATEPNVLLLDEVSGGLTEPEVQSLVSLITQLKRPGLAIIWIEHIAHALKAVCDRIVLMHLGKVVLSDTPEAVISSTEARDLYLGDMEGTGA